MNLVSKDHDKNKAVRDKIHQVEGYDPYAELVEFDIVDQQSGEVLGKKKHLPLNEKKTWFRMEYPYGLVYTRIIAEASDASDADYWAEAECFIVPDCRERDIYIARTTQIASSYAASGYHNSAELRAQTRNLAKAKAASTALYEAGYGIAVESMSEENAAADAETERLQNEYAAPKADVPPAPKKRPGKKEAAKEVAKEEKAKAELSAIKAATAKEPAPDFMPEPVKESESAKEPEEEKSDAPSYKGKLLTEMTPQQLLFVYQTTAGAVKAAAADLIKESKEAMALAKERNMNIVTEVA